MAAVFCRKITPYLSLQVDSDIQSCYSHYITIPQNHPSKSQPAKVLNLTSDSPKTLVHGGEVLLLTFCLRPARSKTNARQKHTHTTKHTKQQDPHTHKKQNRRPWARWSVGSVGPPDLTGQDPQGGGLARAVGAQQAEALPLPDAQADVLYRVHVPEMPPKPWGKNEGFPLFLFLSLRAAGSAKKEREREHPLPFWSELIFGWWSLMGNPSPNKNNKGGGPAIFQSWPTDVLLLFHTVDGCEFSVS